MREGPRGDEPVALALEAIRSTRVYEGVVAQLEQLVSSGQLKPGDKLPSERELCRMFQVGRSSIRDALRHLQALGMVRSRHGGGTVVQDLSPEAIVTPLASMLSRRRLLVEELMDVRAIVEPPLARRAARNASDEDLEQLRAIVERQQERVRHGELTIEEDAEFHGVVARAAGNHVMLSVLDVLMDLLAETRSHALQGRKRSVRSSSAHHRILRAIERRSPEAAEAAMREHIQGVRALVARRLRPATRRTTPRRRSPRRGAARKLSKHRTT